MRTQSDHRPTSVSVVGGLCLVLSAGAGLLPGVASAQTGAGAGIGASAGAPAANDPRVKYIYKPVACTPCPCECPEPRGGGTVRDRDTASAPAAPRPVLAQNTGDGDDDRAPRPAAPAASGSGGAGSSAAQAAAQANQARGGIGGSVVVKDRGGKEKGDRSDVVVYIEQVPKKYAALKKVRQMAQREKAFVPRVVAVTKGSVVDFPNEDKFFHNVFSLSEGNTFDLGLYRAGESKSVTFEKTGVVDVYCNIHPNMWAQILVLDNPFFTTTAKDGTFEIQKVPPGTYSVAAWVSGGEPTRQQIKVEPGKRIDLKFDVQEGSSNKPHLNKFNQPYERYK